MPAHFFERRFVVRIIVVVVALMALALPAIAAKPSSGANALSFTGQPTDSSAREAISPVVAVSALNSKGQLNTKFKGTVTIALQGAGTLFGITTRAAVNGVATFPDINVDPAGSYTLVASTNGLASATSNSFAITGLAIACGSGTCSGSTGDVGNPTPQDSIIGVVSVPTSACPDANCFLTIDETPGDICGGPCVGNAVKFLPTSNAAGVYVVDWACDKSICPGTGVANFTMFLEKADLSIVTLTDCSNPTPLESELPCVHERSRTGVGDLVVTVWLTTDGDPRMAGG
jgi:hypothetical protein